MHKLAAGVTALLIQFVVGTLAFGQGPERPGTRPKEGPGMPDVVYVEGSTHKVCQLTGEFDHETHEPTASRTVSRYGLIAADLGYSFEHRGRLFFLFGDSLAAPTFRGKPNRSSDPPRLADDNDALGFTSDARIDRDPRLDFYRDSIGAYANPVVLDAAGRPAITLATDEVPIAGISIDGRMYVIFGTDNPHRHAKPPEPLGFATRSVVGVSNDDGRSFHYLYDFSKGEGAKFINTAIAHGPDGYLNFWGTQGGDLYRHSRPFFARKKAALMGRDGGMEYFAGFEPDGAPRFSPAENDATPLFTDHEGKDFEPQPCMGELSVEWNRYVKRWVMLYNCNDRTPDNLPGIYMRVAEHAWGPWSAPQTIFNAARDHAYCNYIHRAVTPATPACDNLGGPAVAGNWGGAYGPYFISRFTTGDEARRTSTFYYTLSTWIPYGQVIVKSTIRSLP